MRWKCVLAVLLLGTALQAEETAVDLYRRARVAERNGDVVQAYLLYSQASAKEPDNKEFWGRAQSLQSKAALLAKATPLEAPEPAEPAAPPDPTLPPLASLSNQDLAEIAAYKGPVDLSLPSGQRKFDAKAPAKALWEQAGKDLGLDVVFDRDYGADSSPQIIRLDDVSPRELLRALEAATASFLVPIGDHLILVAKDTPQKRQELETNVAVAVPIPETVSTQEAQEIARGVQQVFEIQKLVLDDRRRLVFLRAPISKARPAELLLGQLMHHRPEVEVELQFIDISKLSSQHYGLSLPSSFPLVSFGGTPGLGLLPRFLKSAGIPSGFANFLGFGGGASFLGLGLANAQLFASATDSQSTTLLDTTIRSVEGQAAQFKVGERYPIPSAQYSYGTTTGTGSNQLPGYALPPTFNFEDLGLVLKITPRVHSSEDVSLEVEAEFKELGGASVDSIPIITNRKFNSKIRLHDGEWGVVAGLMTATEARTLSGLAGTLNIPVLGPLVRDTQTSKDHADILLVIKPRLLSLPPTEFETRELWVGTETRGLTPL